MRILKWFAQAKMLVSALLCLVSLCVQAQQYLPPATAFAAGDFAQVKRYLDSVDKDFAAGKLGSEDVFGRYYKLITPDSQSPALIKAFEAYQSAHKDSYSMATLLGFVYVDYAIIRRGAAYGDRTSDKQHEAYAMYLQKAERVLQSSLALSSRPYLSYARLISVNQGLGNFQEVGRYYRLAVGIDSNAYPARATFIEAITPFWGGSLELMDAYLAYVQKEPISDETKNRVKAEIFVRQAQQYGIDMRRSLTVEFYEKAFDAYPRRSSLDYLIRAADISKQDGDYERAADLYSKGLSFDSDDGRFLLLRAELFLGQLADIPSALKDYERAAEKNNGQALLALGRLYLLGMIVPRNLDKAEGYFARAAQTGQGIEATRGIELVIQFRSVALKN